MNLRAYAKINIGLRILGKRPDEYHNIETIFHQIDLYDELILERADSLGFTSSSPGIPIDSSNLCVRAALLLQRHCHTSMGISIYLKKNIPVGAGLGGGSSDAAAVLNGMNKLWNTGVPIAQLESLGAQLGSDVPFLIRGGTAVGTSRGEILHHIDLRLPYWIVTATPAIHVSTGWAYSNVQLVGNTDSEKLLTVVERSILHPDEFSKYVKNDFEDVVYQTHPAIRHVRDDLVSAGAFFAQLSGSGSSVYGLFEEEPKARAYVDRARGTYSTSLTAPSFRPSQPD
jgi:4-diphosphocytidyl-2-C-methyl-D-erythritol kinase